MTDKDIERMLRRIIYELPTSKVERNEQLYSRAVESDKCEKLKRPHTRRLQFVIFLSCIFSQPISRYSSHGHRITMVVGLAFLRK